MRQAVTSGSGVITSRRPDDIWKEIVAASEIPGTTSAPKLQPIETRIVMLQSGMRAPMGDQGLWPRSREHRVGSGSTLERFSRSSTSTSSRATVYADRVVGKPYLEIDIDRKRDRPLRRAHRPRAGRDRGRRRRQAPDDDGGGRERYPVRVRYLRELRDSSSRCARSRSPGAGRPCRSLSGSSSPRFATSAAPR